MIQHLFLIGDKRVGKTTLLQTALSGLSLPLSGFRTVPFDYEGERKGYLLHSLLPLPPFENNLPAVLRLGPRRHISVPEVWETLGVELLNRSLSASQPFILMDELGKSEAHVKTFQQAVWNCLESPKHILGVLQRGDYPLRSAIIARSDVFTLEVTLENRDSLLPQLLEILAGF